MQFCNEQRRTQPLFSPPCASATYGSARMCRRNNNVVMMKPCDIRLWSAGCIYPNLPTVISESIPDMDSTLSSFGVSSSTIPRIYCTNTSKSVSGFKTDSLVLNQLSKPSPSAMLAVNANQLHREDNFTGSNAC